MTFKTTNLGLIASVGVFMLTGCSILEQKKSDPAATVTPSTLSTSYDYTKPDDIARQSKPVWILPRTTSGWKKAVADDASGEWRSGQYVAKIIEPGRWATLEEAELAGKPYIVPGDDKPVIPIKLRDQSPTSTGELNATTLEQKLASLEKRAASKGPSETSVSNQAAIPPNILQQGTKPPAPGLNIPGLGQAQPQAQPTPSQPLPEPTKLTIPPPPIKQTAPSTPAKKVEAIDTPTTKTNAVPSPPPLSLPGAAKPSAKYNSEKNELTVGYSDPGTDFSIQTPKGPVKIAYKEAGLVDITFGGKTETVTVSGKSDVLKITLSN